MSRINQIHKLAILLLVLCMAACDGRSPGGDASSAVKVPAFKPVAPPFSADSAYRHIEKQLSYGPRIPNTQAHAACADWLASQFKAYGAEVTVQVAQVQDRTMKMVNMRNIIASFNSASTDRVMVTAHWDSRPLADKDGKNPTAAVPGANDGGSGVAILLEVARHLGQKAPPVGVDLILWDAEDNGSYNDNESWCLGSQYWAKHPHKSGYRARYGINLDMVGAKDARFTKDGYSLQSAREETDRVWSIAAQIGYGNYFSSAYTDFASIDDHYYVMKGAGIPMVEVIDRNITTGEFFPHWHTATDDLNVIDKATLKATGQVVLEVLYQEK
ncbi:MAG: hypothetical protein RLZZ165_2272 [Bacteroidota bacterium]